MKEVRPRQKVVVVGAGPVGCLAALYAAQRGDDVEIYELRQDPRMCHSSQCSTTSGAIGLVLSERGLSSIRELQNPALLGLIEAKTVPMYGRMIHGRYPSGELWEKAQSYDNVNGKFTNATDRSHLTNILLDELERTPNISVFFNHKFTGANLKTNQAVFQFRSGNLNPKHLEASFDMIIGADGAYSATRSQIMKYTPMDYQQKYDDIRWCEIQITERARSSQLSRNHLHIWPGRESMFVAVPAPGGTFTYTLFAPFSHYSAFFGSPEDVKAYFDTRFPGVSPDLVDPGSLQKQLMANPCLPLVGTKCSPYHSGHNAVIVGDAAHAVLPFYGQGLNAGMEDVCRLFEHLDNHGVYQCARSEIATTRAAALTAYSRQRVPDGHAIHDLSRANYLELRWGVLLSVHQLRKRMEEAICKYLPQAGWATQYTRVSFTTEPYSAIVQASTRQERALILASAVITAIIVLLAYWLFI
ncbi:kynurenine 3-monooxygenase [Aspergillus bertholletiae]|uniref:Kynurenine 3-monooxygenase n=1 Tax=Aspergillus bertholletiae TaxID=1226010 RepID=A0A5N7B4N5_9EURO|nr:kynurenine 3-monooxygenase [Aspergillus bertholletiae]